MLHSNHSCKNLVILCSGDSPEILFFEDADKRNYELLVIYYGDDPVKFKNKFKTFDNFQVIKGLKFNIIKKYYDNNNKFFKKYKSILMPDDDILLRTKDINYFFEIFNKYKLSLAQPSLIGYFSHLITLHKFENILRYTNFVEIMMPCFSFESFAKCIGTFDMSLNGHGLDFLWPKILNYPNEKIAIIDEIIAIHSRKVGSNNTYNDNTDYNFFDFMEKNNLNKIQDVIGYVLKEKYDKEIFDENYYPYSETFKLLIENYKGN